MRSANAKAAKDSSQTWKTSSDSRGKMGRSPSNIVPMPMIATPRRGNQPITKKRARRSPRARATTVTAMTKLVPMTTAPALDFQLGETAESSKAMADGIAYLRRTQLPEGSWYGRWGLNYIYGTWSVLCALNVAGVDRNDPMIRKAVEWLASVQNQDGGWGEDAVSYRLDYKGYEVAPSTSSQTAWALLGLMAAGEVENPVVVRGVEYLKATQTEKGLWDEQRYTATGFPRVFYLRYHGYSKFFPLWALARYRNLRSTNSRVVGVGM